LTATTTVLILFQMTSEGAVTLDLESVDSGTLHASLHPAHVEDAVSLKRLASIKWDFSNEHTRQLTHGIHPYPAKFIPQIPAALIEELTAPGETVADVFCGSGTTLLESLRLRRNVIGIDANPLAALISRAKVRPLDKIQTIALRSHRAICQDIAEHLRRGSKDPFDNGVHFVSSGWRPDSEVCEFWFLPHVVEELAELRKLIREISDDTVRTLCEVVFSSIIVTVSKQDSDTRYVRREKIVSVGNVFRRYIAQLDFADDSIQQLSRIVDSELRCDVLNCNVLDAPDVGFFDLLVTSPPYPNAYSYHLYHRTRLLWLGHDPESFKKIEIGSHRKYSAKGVNRADENTFRSEFETIFGWVRRHLRDQKYACFIVGDSTLAGRRIDNASLISDVGTKSGFREVARLERVIQATKKTFNPAIGKIKSEKILILRKC
jgi:DNA modification methylase